MQKHRHKREKKNKQVRLSRRSAAISGGIYAASRCMEHTHGENTASVYSSCILIVYSMLATEIASQSSSPAERRALGELAEP